MTTGWGRAWSFPLLYFPLAVYGRNNRCFHERVSEGILKLQCLDAGGRIATQNVRPGEMDFFCGTVVLSSLHENLREQKKHDLSGVGRSCVFVRFPPPGAVTPNRARRGAAIAVQTLATIDLMGRLACQRRGELVELRSTWTAGAAVPHGSSKGNYVSGDEGARY